jgi:hypothetical protein
MFRQKKIESLGTIGDFMKGKHHMQEPKKMVDFKKYKAVAAGSMIPLVLSSKAFAAESANQCGQVLAVAAPVAVPVNAVTDKVMGDVIAAFAHLFDPLIDLMIAISFPVASAMIVFKLFMMFFKDQAEVWEGIGKIGLVYVLIQMSPIFIKILKSLGTLAVGI